MSRYSSLTANFSATDPEMADRLITRGIQAPFALMVRALDEFEETVAG
jgi:hypothetical protein